MKYFIIAGEASGDLHGSFLINALREQDPEAEIRFWGGNHMAQAAGHPPLKHINELSFMGVWEVLKHLHVLRKHFKQCKSAIQAFEPDALIFIDYPGFNLRMARWAHGQGFNTQYYISPKLWAWNKKRIDLIRKYIRDLCVIFPFEVDFYRKNGIEVQYVGNPLVEELDVWEKTQSGKRSANEPTIALLPGSRVQEVKRILPVLLDVIPHFPEFRFAIACIRTVPHTLYTKILEQHPNGGKATMVYDQTYALLKQSAVSLVASGTSTLEAALLGTPQIVCYKTSPLTYHLAKRFLKLKYISLVNLIMDAPVVKELIQHDLNSNTLVEEIHQLLSDEHRQRLTDKYEQLRDLLGHHSTSREVARGIIRSIPGKKSNPSSV